MSEAHHHNPISEASLTIDGVEPGLAFVVFRAGKMAEQGTFSKTPEYDENDGWFGALAQIEGVEKSVDVYDMGIICHHDGTWAEDTFTVEDSSL